MGGIKSHSDGGDLIPLGIKSHTLKNPSKHKVWELDTKRYQVPFLKLQPNKPSSSMRKVVDRTRFNIGKTINTKGLTCRIQILMVCEITRKLTISLNTGRCDGINGRVLMEFCVGMLVDIRLPTCDLPRPYWGGVLLRIELRVTRWSSLS